MIKWTHRCKTREPALIFPTS